MALYQIKISYDGTDFHGYQRQPDHRTVQGEIEHALKVIGWPGNSILSAGRTDAGVHAEGQIAVVEYDWKHSSIKLQRAINSVLSEDVSILEVINVSNQEIHPRFDAKSRVYRYQINTVKIRQPTIERYSWRVWPKPDIRLMNTAAELLIGRHDFIRFGRPYKEDGRTERIVKFALWIGIGEEQINFRIEANSFLYHMVRRIVFVLVLTGQRKIELEDVAKELEGVYNLPAGIAPAKGLFLENINY